MFQTGLSVDLVSALKELYLQCPAITWTIHMRLLDLISTVTPFSHSHVLIHQVLAGRPFPRPDLRGTGTLVRVGTATANNTSSGSIDSPPQLPVSLLSLILFLSFFFCFLFLSS